MTSISTARVPSNIDGPALVAAASGLMLLPENASRLVRLHRLAALGMALDNKQASSIGPNAVRSLLRTNDIGGPGILAQEDPYSEVLVQSVSFYGGPYLVSPGSGEHTVADLENLLDAAFREQWMEDKLRGPAKQLVLGLLTISDIVLRRADLRRGTLPDGSTRTSIYVPGSNRLKELSQATFLSNDELDAHSDWLRMVVDTFALDPGELVDPCAGDITDYRLYTHPFLRLSTGYQLVLPLDLLITIRFHLLRFVRQEGELEKFGRQWRNTAFRRFMRALPYNASPTVLEHNSIMSRYLLPIDSKRDLHIIVATDPLVDWQPEVWGTYDTHVFLDQLAQLMEPNVRRTYSSAETVLHLVITDSPGRGAFWGIPNITDSDPVLMARSDDLEIMLHHEPDGPLGLLLFAEAVDRRPGQSMTASVLDEFSSYNEHEKSFYFTDDRPATFTLFQIADGLQPRKTYFSETDRHGVVSPLQQSIILQARRRYTRDAPEIFIIEPYHSYVGYVIELGAQKVFVTCDLDGAERVGVELDLLECVAYWVRECAISIENQNAFMTTELVVKIEKPDAWKKSTELSRSQPAIRVSPKPGGFTVELTETFVSLLQEKENTAERELVSALLLSLFGLTLTGLELALNKIAPLGAKRMLNSFNQNTDPDMLAKNLPRPLTGHDQVMAQLLDEVGQWLRAPAGGKFQIKNYTGSARNELLNSAVAHLFNILEKEIAAYDRRTLLDFLIAQNEALSHDAKFNTILLESRLACFGENSHTVHELVEHRKENTSAHRANRFLIEYVAAQPPTGTDKIEVRDYYRLLSIAKELIDRATASDFLRYDIADFQVSVLPSGRLGLSRNEAIATAMEIYAAASSQRSIRAAQNERPIVEVEAFDYADFIDRSSDAMRSEFGFTLTELRTVCSGLLDIAIADQVTRIDRSEATSKIVESTDLMTTTVNAVLDKITLTPRASFLEIEEDAWPWRYNRDSSYIRRPLVQQGSELVFGFRSIYRLGPYWLDNLLSGRLQGKAKTTEMQRCITEARKRINDEFARSVARRLQTLGMDTRMSVIKIGKKRITGPNGQDLGDIDVLAYHPGSRSVLAVEAKDFEIARTPAEMSNEFEKLFLGRKKKKPTVELHQQRIEWLRANLTDVMEELGIKAEGAPCKLIGLIVTSDPLITPLVKISSLPVIPFEDIELATLGLAPTRHLRTSRKGRKHR